MEKNIFISQDVDKMLEKRVKSLVAKSLVRLREPLIENFIERKFNKFPDADRLLTSKEVVDIFSISPQTLGRWIKKGVIIPINLDAKRNYRFRKSDLYDLIEKKGVKKYGR